MAAAAAALAMGLSRETVASGLRSFTGVPHRLERLGEIDWRPLRQRLEGHERHGRGDRPRLFDAGVAHDRRRPRKGESFEPLLAPQLELRQGRLPDRGGRRNAAIATWPRRRTAASTVPCTRGLDEAVARASEVAQVGEIVLLAPACASFDVYADFEARGEHFRSLVEALR